MVWLKACPRCGGDLFEERDWYTRTVKCFQCGRVLDPAQEQEIRMKLAAQKEKEVSQNKQEPTKAKGRKHRKAA